MPEDAPFLILTCRTPRPYYTRMGSRGLSRSCYTGFLIPIFLVGNIFCVCLPAGTQATSAGHHTCSHGSEQSPSNTTDHRPNCQHCNHAQSFKTVRVELPAAAPVFELQLPILPRLQLGAELTHCSQSIRGAVRSLPPPDILLGKCSLLI